jgi:uncharacterized protein (TIGR00297 family)
MTSASPFSEDGRQIVHMTMGVFALLLRDLPWWLAAVLAGSAIAFNVLVLPQVGGRRFFRPADVARGYPAGILFYPVAVLLLILVFPDRPDIAAAAWGILAFGDGAATMAGRRIGGAPIPWNREKTFAGSIAFTVAGGSAGALLAWWCRPAVDPPPAAWFALVGPGIAALAAALVETIPIRLDDNLSVPAAAAGVLWGLSLVSDELIAAAPAAVGPALPAAVALNALAAALGFRARTVSASGAIGGAMIGIIIYACAGWRGWLLLFATFAAATLSSRLGLRRKTLLGIAEERGGRRGAGNAVANTGVAAAAALLALLSPAHDTALVAFVAALAAGGSDTVASEVGKAWGRRTVLITALRAVPPGTSGAVSLEGTVAGLTGAAALGVLGIALQLAPGSALPAIVGGAVAGSMAESVLGATLEAPGFVNNDVLNFLNTAIAALCAILLLGAAA